MPESVKRKIRVPPKSAHRTKKHKMYTKMLFILPVHPPIRHIKTPAKSLMTIDKILPKLISGNNTAKPAPKIAEIIILKYDDIFLQIILVQASKVKSIQKFSMRASSIYTCIVRIL
jgi:hypothetical protein